MRARGWVLPLVCGFLCMYFGFHLMYGQRSIFAYFDTLAQRNEIEKLYLDTRAERLALEADVRRMRPAHLSPAYLEERARIVLGYVAPNEIVVITQP